MDTAVEVTIENLGSERAERTEITRQIDGETVDEATLTTIDPGESVTKRFDWKAEEGKSSFGATVYPENQIEELDETNNAKSINFGGVFLPDLVVESITWGPASASVGDMVTFTVTIGNQGEGNSRNSRVHFESDGASFDPGRLDTIAAGGSATTTFRWAAGVGIHRFEAVVDFEWAVAETDESNNALAVEYASKSEVTLAAPQDTIHCDFFGFPERFFQESSITREHVERVVSAQAWSLTKMHNGVSPYSRFGYCRVEYDPEAYGYTMPYGIKLGDLAFPGLNSGHHRWEVMAHEHGHNFFGGTKPFYYDMAAPGPFLQESLAVLSAFYTFHDLLENQQEYGIDDATVESLAFDFSNGRAYQVDRFNEYVDQGEAVQHLRHLNEPSIGLHDDLLRRSIWLG